MLAFCWQLKGQGFVDPGFCYRRVNLVAILILAFFPSSSSFSDRVLHTVSPSQMLHVLILCLCTAALLQTSLLLA